MDGSKIPKPGLKPPTRIPRTGTTAKLLPIPESKATSTRAPPRVPEPATIQSIKTQVVPSSENKSLFPTHKLLRRRSKSISDLRPLKNEKPLKSWEKPALLKAWEKPPPLRVGQKRPALQKQDENKPKVPKMKIPSWDYKSKYNELLKKYTGMQDQVKDLQCQLTDFDKVKEEVVVLREENLVKTKLLNELEKNEVVWLQEKDELTKEQCNLKCIIAKQEEAYRILQDSHKLLAKEHEENLLERANLKQVVAESSTRIAGLENKRDNLERLTQELKENLEEHETLRRSLHNTIQDMKGNIRVFCRVRPPVTIEENDKLLCSIFFPTETNLEIRKSRESVSICGKPIDLKQDFSFDKVFPPEASQSEVFEELSQLVQSALDGYHVCVFAYGQTGSGKTYTMQGSHNDSGMIPRTVDLVFEKIKKLALSDWTYSVSASFLEIYNENVRDLLVPNSTHNYELRYNEGRGVTVTNLTTLPISSAAELKNLMDEAHKNRAVAATDFNEHSSRSHAVTKIHLEGYNKISNAKYAGSVNLVDLAGSESAKTSSAERLTETKSINKSLSVLGNVMLALHNKDPHIPYRNSKLTFLLQSCLGGNSKTLMFVNIAPFEECFGESINSLRFASKVKEIKMTARKNKTYCAMPSIPAKMM